MTPKQAKEIWDDLVQEPEVLSKLGISLDTLRRYRRENILQSGKDYFSVKGRNHLYRKDSLLKIIGAK